MPIFIPLFIGLFVVVPLLLTKMAADLLHIRKRMAKVALFMVICALNWRMWQAPERHSQAPQAVALQRVP